MKSGMDRKKKVLSADIIVTGTKEKPYFEIKYKEVGKKHYNLGFGSYYLGYVFEWKDEYLEVIEKRNILKKILQINMRQKIIKCITKIILNNYKNKALQCGLYGTAEHINSILDINESIF